jgi:hypothetical protein
MPAHHDRPPTASLLLAGLQLPGADNGVFYGICIPVLEVGDDHHAVGEAPWHRERLGERAEQEVSEVERRTDDEVAVVELPRDQAPAVPPVEQPVAAPLGDTVELAGQAAEVGDPHQRHDRKPSICASWRNDLLEEHGVGQCSGMSPERACDPRLRQDPGMRMTHGSEGGFLRWAS